MISLSILDQSPVAEGSTPETALQQTVELAKMAEKLGYKRFWVSEHHFSRNLAGSSPEVLMSYLAAKTEKIRIGSGGVMLPHYSAYKVAENFRVLEGLAPGRIDAGLGRAPGGMPIASMALQDGGRRGADRYPEQIGDLVTYLYDQADEHHRFPNLTASPKVGSAPDVWLLGSSGESAGLAAQVGASYTFAQFINGEGGEDAVRLYKERFKPSILGDQPRSTVAVFVLCAETEEAAERLAKSLDYSLLANEQGMVTEGFPSLDTALSYQYSPYEKKRIEDNRKRMVIGTRGQVKKQLLKLAEAYGTEEIMAVTITHDFQDKLTSYRLLAEAFQN
ncbi:LLM class flavin-dependent oxidoreductase [Bacillus sonorensis]|uniref:LLM class flavin-dependent oxidoreductase n=1 Tax=Bacillus sonorensis TaxID=119858 RepID=UPI002282655D|nr:LLM class flavin-dependent oxidoreductase [Bacillus sonorensis]MCY7857902.1 LLM class flavin-dependent oxidoreductase [Bacillus sonorensis]MCY8033360.1 LLM class flavin-dependent oxidoreductase [Bacillus sonorensis]MCY8561610.1 LLM class flavin-dependent oxidoreductase [Bacillus sonorensis]MCZ0068313.1 LLM class flavin-dependent oxidoreductase [Bacillus sonorensis]MCZ0094708.1 LLM class flavin-dependent oxidoreductase [Bacillus sonorensis]